MSPDPSRIPADGLVPEKVPVDGVCPECGAEELAAYPVLAADGWFEVVKCQQHQLGYRNTVIVVGLPKPRSIDRLFASEHVHH